eukprot:10311980-Prorocentrum_lima.AAC.1
MSRVVTLIGPAAHAALGACSPPGGPVDHAVRAVSIAFASGGRHRLLACTTDAPAVPPPLRRALHARAVLRRHAPHAG